MTTATTATGERADLLASLAGARHFLRFTVRDLTDEQARLHPTVSALCLGGLVKHVAAVEAGWADFVVNGPGEKPAFDEAAIAAHLAGFQMREDETLAGILEEYDRVGRATDELVANLPDLDLTHPLPEAPWNKPGQTWSARRAIIHIIAETTQHAGHADIIRETIDGQKTMG